MKFSITKSSFFTTLIENFPSFHAGTPRVSSSSYYTQILYRDERLNVRTCVDKPYTSIATCHPHTIYYPLFTFPSFGLPLLSVNKGGSFVILSILGCDPLENTRKNSTPLTSSKPPFAFDSEIYCRPLRLYVM